jgi:hypothetical protein
MESPIHLLNLTSNIAAKDSECSEIDYVRLIEEATSARDRAYMTLSHRWGTKTSIQLLQENRRSMLTAITLDSLPATFEMLLISAGI